MLSLKLIDHSGEFPDSLCIRGCCTIRQQAQRPKGNEVSYTQHGRRGPEPNKLPVTVAQPQKIQMPFCVCCKGLQAAEAATVGGSRTTVHVSSPCLCPPSAQGFAQAFLPFASAHSQPSTSVQIKLSALETGTDTQS